MVTKNVNVFEAKAKFSEDLDRAAAGERILICRHNKPVAELRALDQVRLEPRPIGPIPGRPTFEVPASFFEPLSDEELDRWDAAGIADVLSMYGPRASPKTSRVAESKADDDAPLSRRVQRLGRPRRRRKS